MNMDALGYVTHCLLHEYQEKSGQHIGIVKWYKSMYELKERIKEREVKINIGLPWSWYIHGPVVEYYDMEGKMIQLDEEQVGGEYTQISVLPIGKYNGEGINKSDKEIIAAEIESIVSEFYNLPHQKVTEIVYERRAKHPFDLIFRKFVKGFDKDRLDYSKRDLVAIPQLREKFPFDEFPRLSVIFSEWLAFVRLVIGAYPRYLYTTPRVIKDVQKAYGSCMSLKYHENIRDYVLASWKEKNNIMHNELLDNLRIYKDTFFQLEKIKPKEGDEATRDLVGLFTADFNKLCVKEEE